MSGFESERRIEGRDRCPVMQVQRRGKETGTRGIVKHDELSPGSALPIRVAAITSLMEEVPWRRYAVYMHYLMLALFLNLQKDS